MTAEFLCWKCAAPFGDLPLPLARRAECRSCRTELHVCRMCRFFDPGVAKSCRETVADEVNDKERANFCGYFMPRAGAHAPAATQAARDARAQLEALFGASAPAVDAQAGRGPLEELFAPRKPDGSG